MRCAYPKLCWLLKLVGGREGLESMRKSSGSRFSKRGAMPEEKKAA